MAKRWRIEELNEKVSLLIEQKEKLEAEADEWAEKRDRRNELFRKLGDEISGLKRERDEGNEKVKDLKLKRNEVTSRIKEEIQDLKNLRGIIKAAAEKKPSRTPQSLKEQFDNIEWKIQTTHMSLQEEKELVEQVKQIEIQLNIYKKLEELRQEDLGARAEVQALRTEGQSYHEELKREAERSQECHQKMLSKIEESKKIKAEAYNLHETFVQTREKTKPIQQEIAILQDQIRQLKGEVRQKEEEERRQTEGAILSELERRAREKVKRGEELTWEEFQLLAEKGIDTETGVNKE